MDNPAQLFCDWQSELDWLASQQGKTPPEEQDWQDYYNAGFSAQEALDSYNMTASNEGSAIS